MKNIKNKIFKLENYIKELERKLKEKENKINEEKIKNEELINKIKLFENNSNNYSLNDRILELENELNKFKSYWEKLISVKFISTEQIINNFTKIGKNTDRFSKLEEILYEKYPNYRSGDNYFIVNRNKVKRNMTLEENNIKDNDVLTLTTNYFD